MTKLNPIQEAMFQKWYAQLPNVQKGMMNPNPDDPEHFYDMRAAWLQGLQQPDALGHFPSQFKQLGHPRYFLGGVNTTQDNPSDYELQDLLGRPKLDNPLNGY